jgi:hypothetical protein
MGGMENHSGFPLYLIVDWLLFAVLVLAPLFISLALRRKRR